MKRTSFIENGVELFRYSARVKQAGKVGEAEFVDWFRSDEEARSEYPKIMSEQGYKVVGIEIGEPCIVEVVPCES